MKSPRQHYVEAERLMAKVAEIDSPSLPITRDLVAQAQVHATLATAEPGRIPPEPLAPAPGPIETPTLRGDHV